MPETGGTVMGLFDMFKDKATELNQGAKDQVSELTGIDPQQVSEVTGVDPATGQRGDWR
jgi:hypothetical protein